MPMKPILSDRPSLRGSHPEIRWTGRQSVAEVIDVIMVNAAGGSDTFLGGGIRAAE